MPNRGVIGHLPEFFRVQCCGLAEQTFIYCHLPNVMEIPGRAKGGTFVRIHSHRVSDCRRVSPYSQRMSVNVYVLYVDGSGEGLERVVVEAVKGSHEPQILRHQLRESLSERMDLDGQRHVVAQQVERLKVLLVIEGIRILTTARQCSYELA